jgi:hypothetical protein
MRDQRALCEAGDAGQNAVYTLGPNEGLWGFVRGVDEVTDSQLEFTPVPVRATLEWPLLEELKPAFHHVEPGTIGGREVDVKAWPSDQPALDQR